MTRSRDDETLDGTMAMPGGIAERILAPPEPRTLGPPLPGRYEDIEIIAAGSFGEVRRVRDTLLDRVVAMKLLHAEHTDAAAHRLRFLAEAQITAQLQHPGIVALYDQGELADGRLWFTMKEVRGRTLRTVIDELHAASGPEGFGVTSSGWTFRRLVDAFARIAQAVAYAHSRGVVHRDLKPDNLMVGEFGEVLVMDWGLARRFGDVEPPSASGDRAVPSAPPPAMTRHGDVLGTPAYMAPEQASGDTRRHGTWSDVYALGAVLYHLLAGRPPYLKEDGDVLGRLLEGAPVPVMEAARGGPPQPAELVEVCERAMRREIEARYPSAERLAEGVVAWLDGVRRREQALAQIDQARSLEPGIAAARAEAEEARARARVLQDTLRSFDSVEKKRPSWELEDKADRADRSAALAETRWLQMLYGALTLDPGLPEAHARLADYYKTRLAAAELVHHEEDAARYEVLLRAHDRGQHQAFLRGDGALTLVTDPPGAEVIVERYEPCDRRLAPMPYRHLGSTPLCEEALPHGSYLLRLRAPGRVEVRYPVLIERGGHWDGCAPSESEPYPIALPADGELGLDDCYVPAGWCWVGGDREATDSLPARRIWVDAFVIRRFPVTNAEYLEFLNDLMAQGREEEAVAACPRAPLGMPDKTGNRPFFEREDGGRFVAREDEQGRAVLLDAPVVLVAWFGAIAYARWISARNGLGWRLPDELEREKAARGVDARHCPWGDHLEPTFACVIESHADEPALASVSSFPVDESPYGVRGLAGNSRDWCGNVWRMEGPPLDGGRLRVEEAAFDDAGHRVVRGSAWISALAFSRSATRFGLRPMIRRTTLGLRLSRSYCGR
jgi:serine/threonine-protein kinase